MNGPIRLGMRGLDTEGGKSNQIAAISAPTPETPLLNQQFAQPPNPFPSALPNYNLLKFSKLLNLSQF